MYGHINNDGTVGELFEKMPSGGLYHESYLSAVEELPPGAGAGWRRGADGLWKDPKENLMKRAEAFVRAERDSLLNRADTIYCNAANWELMNLEERASWQAYKQALRDITEQEDFPLSPVWPRMPL